MWPSSDLCHQSVGQRGTRFIVINLWWNLHYKCDSANLRGRNIEKFAYKFPIARFNRVNTIHSSTGISRGIYHQSVSVSMCIEWASAAKSDCFNKSCEKRIDGQTFPLWLLRRSIRLSVCPLNRHRPSLSHSLLVARRRCLPQTRFTFSSQAISSGASQLSSGQV